MSTVQIIDVNRIDPNSTINVRRQGVEENVEKVKASIQQHGYWPDQPIIVRPHPDSGSTYDYQNVTGQCRLKACLALELEEIPAFVLELNDDEAIQRSWLENEARGDLTYSAGHIGQKEFISATMEKDTRHKNLLNLLRSTSV